jgi:hypothetical protein
MNADEEEMEWWGIGIMGKSTCLVVREDPAAKRLCLSDKEFGVNIRPQ